MRLPNKLSVAATVLGLGGLTGVAMSAGASKRDHTASPAADIRTVTTRQTIHRYNQIVAGGTGGPTGTGVKAVASYRTAAGKVATRPSGHRSATGSASTSAGTKPTTSPSGKSGKTHSSTGTHKSAPKTRSSGTKTTQQASGGDTGASPTTKPSGTVTEAPTTTTPGAPPTTKPSGSTPEAPKTGETPPTTKPSGAGGETGGGEKGKESEGGGKEHHDD